MIEYKVTYYPEDKLCIAVMPEKKVSYFDMAGESTVKIVEDARFVQGMRVIWDYRLVEDVVDSDYLITLAQSNSFYAKAGDILGKSRRAFLCSNATVFGLLRQWELVSGKDDYLRVFTNLPEVFAWIGIENWEKFDI